MYGWELPERPIFVRWFEDAEGVSIPVSSDALANVVLSLNYSDL